MNFDCYLEAHWRELMESIIGQGRRVSPRGLPTLELENVRVHFPEARMLTFNCAARKANPVIASVELMYFLNGRDDDVLATTWLKGMEAYLNPETRRFDGGYGPSISEGMAYVFPMLKKDPHTRRAVFPMLQSRHVVRMLETKDYPCNVLVSFNTHDGRLNMGVVTRSQDMFFGYIYDQLEFQTLQHMAAQALQVEPGSFDHYMLSCHLYEKDLKQAARCIASPMNLENTNYKFPFDDVPGFWKYVRSFNTLIDEPAFPLGYAPGDDMALAVHEYAMRKVKKAVSAQGPFTRWLAEWMENDGPKPAQTKAATTASTGPN